MVYGKITEDGTKTDHKSAGWDWIGCPFMQVAQKAIMGIQFLAYFVVWTNRQKLGTFLENKVFLDKILG